MSPETSPTPEELELLRQFWQDQLDAEVRHSQAVAAHTPHLVKFISRSGGSGRRRPAREVTFVKDGSQTHFHLGKQGLQPVSRLSGQVIIDDLLTATGTQNWEDALDVLRSRYPRPK